MKIRVCEKCNKKFDADYKSCPYCGSLKFVDYEVLEKKPTKVCAFCEKEYDVSYKSCPYCGSTKISKINNEPKEEVKEEKVYEEVNKENIEYTDSSKICDDCGNKYSMNLTSCPYCGSTKATSLKLPSDRIYNGDKEFHQKNKKRKEKNEYLKGFYLGYSSDVIEHDMLMKEKSISKNTKKGMEDGFGFRIAFGLIGICLVMIIVIITFIISLLK